MGNSTEIKEKETKLDYWEVTCLNCLSNLYTYGSENKYVLCE